MNLHHVGPSRGNESEACTWPHLDQSLGHYVRILGALQDLHAALDERLVDVEGEINRVELRRVGWQE
jgi:hypothetical protein